MKIVEKQGNPCFKEIDQRDESTLRPAYERVLLEKRMCKRILEVV